MASPEQNRGVGVVEAYKNVNKYVMVGALSLPFLGAFFAPPLILPALEIALAEGANLIGVSFVQNLGGKK